MMKRLTLFVSLLKVAASMVGCSSLPPVNYLNGVTYKQNGSNMFTATYSGDRDTFTTTASNLAQIAAIESCMGKGRRAALFHEVIDESTKEIYTHLYSRDYVSNTLRDKNPTVHSEPMYVHAPRFTVRYSCANNYRALTQTPQITELKPEVVSYATRDFRGGLQVSNIKEAGPLREGDVITHIGGIRVEKVYQFRIALSTATREFIPIRILRNQVELTLKAKTSHATNSLYADNIRRLEEACKFAQPVELPDVCWALAILAE
ncbi:MAG: PDZ domain-containing protein [Bdellovibrionales bacterium]|nr:PDZ domain-containing protein [Bdellovibrionales bacterium]